MNSTIAGGRTRRITSRSLCLSTGLLTALGVWACSDASTVATGPDAHEAVGPVFSEAGGAKAATGGGRTDFPPGTANKQKTHWQTWGFNLVDDNADGKPDGGQVSFVDHRPEVRPLCGDNPCHFKSISISTVTFAGEQCESGRGWRANGRVRETNTGAEYDFEAEVCDNGEPGRSNPNSAQPGGDRFEFFVPELADPNAGQYCVRQLGTGACSIGPDSSRGALMTGGNIQDHAS